jgi:hypothetical protein
MPVCSVFALFRPFLTAVPWKLYAAYARKMQKTMKAMTMNALKPFPQRTVIS